VHPLAFFGLAIIASEVTAYITSEPPGCRLGTCRGRRKRGAHESLARNTTINFTAGATFRKTLLVGWSSS
jgi:hypothetical protein